jgi:hypothetical protein
MPKQIFRVIATERTECVREASPDDEWDQGDDRIHVSFHCAMICPDDHVGGMNAHFVTGMGDGDHDKLGEKVKCGWDYDDDEVALVVSRFATGSTFGRTDGHWEVEGAFSDMKNAETWAEVSRGDLAKKHDDYFGGLEDVEVFWLPFNNLWVARFPSRKVLEIYDVPVKRPIKHVMMPRPEKHRR